METSAASSIQERLQPVPSHAVEVREIHRTFKSRPALRGVSLTVAPGEIHALLGPNGAGKTTLLRILSGLLEPDSGEVRVHGIPWKGLSSRNSRRLIGLAPSGDRSFYLRISGLENLVFFARLHGMSKRQALQRARDCLREVGLEDAARLAVGAFSHGMQKRLSFARAILTNPPVLMIDEATHDLDPQGARRIQELAQERARDGAAILWATQRVDEIRGFADHVTVLHEGEARFTGTVPQLMARSFSRAFVVQLRNRDMDPAALARAGQAVLAGMGSVTLPNGSDGEHFVLSLRQDVILGDALAALTVTGIRVLACREERSEIELAFLLLTEEKP